MTPSRYPTHVLACLLVLVAMTSCAGPAPTIPPAAASDAEIPSPVRSRSTQPSPAPSARSEGRGELPVLAGDPIPLEELTGRIVFDDFEDLSSMRADATDLRRLTERAGAEFDGAWSPGGGRVVYRDSRRGINDDDEIYVMRADGENTRNLTVHPANDWGPDWSSDGAWIAFNSDRDGGSLRGYLVRPDGTGFRPIATGDTWFEYPSFSPDGERIAFMGHEGSDYDIFVVELATGVVTRLTEAPGSDGWPAWSPDGTLIAFSSERDDCLLARADQDCWRSGDPGEHHDIWVMRPDGSDQRRVTPEVGQFVTWSPDGRSLLVSGHTLFVVRPDGTGRTEIRPGALPHAPGGIPDWTS